MRTPSDQPSPVRPFAKSFSLDLGPALSLALCLALGFVFVPSASAQTIVVDEDNTNWGLLAETGTTGVGEFVEGPDTPPIGNGSVHFSLPASADGVLIGTANHNGVRFADLTALSYSTYGNVTPQAIALQFNVDYDDTDAALDWQGRLVFEPLNSGAVTANTWQGWDALAGSWWSTGTPIIGGAAAAQTCTQGSPCTWATVLSTYPNAAVHSTLGAVLLKAGSGWPDGFDGNADALRIATAATDVTYDFETNVPVELMTFTIE